MRVAITGHRPERIKSRMVVQRGLVEAFRKLEISCVIQGMAAGVDLWSARMAYMNDVPFWSVKPWAGHEPRKVDIFDYEQAWDYAEKQVVVDPSETFDGPWVYQRRNEWMVDHSDKAVLAVWDGVEKGGTWNCIKYARSIEGIRIWRIDPDTGELHG